MTAVLVFSQASLLQRGIIYNTASQQRGDILYKKESYVYALHENTKGRV